MPRTTVPSSTVVASCPSSLIQITLLYRPNFLIARLYKKGKPMGSRISREEGSRARPHDLDDGEIVSDTFDPRNRSTPHLRGGNASFTCRGVQNGRYSHPFVGNCSDSDCYEIQAPTAFSSKLSRMLYHLDDPATIVSTGTSDFNNSAQPLPWSRHKRDDKFEVNYTAA